MYISAQLDRETSARAGAGGTFQVITLEDEAGNDLTHLIDVGVHYHSLDEVARDLARALGKEVTVGED